ncbi:MAG: bifunctional hydroxymethylpyrimidine kinase/phosphomethylpyrimidine kinase [Kiritimatiellae bacterium]|nr:bifunctional hydroxymethylpyrimidine kinase/phosphomethylpyrimidine kinase [Kiritimatiellia bacterium]
MRLSAALTIAGSDSGGNAGVQADLRAFHTFGVHGCTVFTALTAQNPFGVRSVILADPAFVGDQIDAVLETYGVMALKTGMLAAPAIIEVVADRLSANNRIPKVIDPVMVATSGARLLQEDAEEMLKERLLPLAYLLTPNIPEAEVLSGRSGVTADGLPDLTRLLADRYGCSVLLKGGHLTERPAEDYFYDGCSLYRLSTPAIDAPLSTHGTGCSLSAAITASAACGHTMLDAVIDGKAYVYESIRTAVHVGEVCTVLGMPKRLPTEAVRVEEIRP